MNSVLCLTISILIANYVALGNSLKDKDSVDVDVEPTRQPLMGIEYYTGITDDYDDNLETLGRDLEPENKEEQTEKEAAIIVLDSTETRNYKAEIRDGNNAEFLGTNSHFYQPNAYPDFSRRFVLQYPYKEAQPELVLEVAKESAIATNADNPTDQIRKDILRTGDYWNAVWKEDVNPTVLRSKNHKKLEMIRTEVAPGSELYDLVSKLKQMSPTLLYVINQRRQ